MEKTLFKKQLVIAIAMSFIFMAVGAIGGQASDSKEFTSIYSNRNFTDTHPTETVPEIPLATLPEKMTMETDGFMEISGAGTDDMISSMPFADGFETYAPLLPPDDPPWFKVLENDTDTNWGVNSFETGVPGENPDPAVWTTIDGGWDGTIFYEGWEDYTAGMAPQSPNWWYNLYGDATLGATATPAGGPAGSTMSMALDEGAVGDDYAVISADNFGPATGYTAANIEFWVYTGPDQTTDADFNLYFYSSSGGTPAIPIVFMSGALGPGTAVAIWYFNGGYNYQEIVDDTWYQVEITYDTVAATYEIRIDGGAWDGPNAFYNTAAIDIQTLQMYGGDLLPADGTGYPSNHMIDDLRHYIPVSGGTEDISVTDTWAFSGDAGTQSLFMDQNNEPNGASTQAAISPAMYGEDIWVWFVVMTDTVSSTNGATFFGIDASSTNFLGIRFSAGNIQYYSSAAWVTIMPFSASTEYMIEIGYNDLTQRYISIWINSVETVTDVPLGAVGAGLAGFRMQGTPSTESRIWLDYIGVYTVGANAVLQVDNTVAHTGTQSLHMMERGADAYSVFGTGFAEGVGIKVGEFSFWFYTGLSQGGMEIYLWDSTGSSLLTLVSLGTDLGSGTHPGSVQWVNNDGTGVWIVNGPTFAPNTWNNLTVRYDVNTQSFDAVWNGVVQGTYGFIASAADLTYAEFYGGAPDVPADFYYDDVYLLIDDPPAAPTALTVEHYGVAVETAEYTYTGVTQATNNHYAYACSVSSIASPGGPVYNTQVEATDANYLQVTASDDSWWVTVDPGNGNEMFMRSQIQVAQTPSNIVEIFMSSEIQGNANTNFQVWAVNSAGVWAQIGTTVTSTADTDTIVGMAITSNCANYIVGGYLRWGVYQTDSSDLVRVDRMNVTVRYYGAASTDHNMLNWSHDGTDVAVYNIYRAAVDTGPYSYIASTNVGTNTYTDLNMGLADSTLWWYIVTAEDALGNEEQNINMVQEPGAIPPTPYAINLAGISAGSWVFVSYPIGISASIESILNDATLGDGLTTWDVAKWYNPQDTSDPWKTYRVSGTGNDMPTITNGMGFWIRITANGGDQTLTLANAATVPATTVVNLYTGWNLVGYPSTTDRLASATLPAEADIVSVYSGSATYTDYTDKSLVNMRHGNAYFVHVTSDCTWTVTEP